MEKMDGKAERGRICKSDSKMVDHDYGTIMAVEEW
jgi:hypothetical protein